MKRSIACLLLGAVAVFWPPFLLAAETMATEGGNLSGAGEGETAMLLLAIVKVIGSLVVVVGLMLLAVYLIKRVGIGQGQSGDGRMINVLDTRMIAPKKYVAVVRIAGQCVALGITDQQINLLTKVEEFSSEEIDPTAKVRLKESQPFAAALKKATGLLGKRNNQKTVDGQ